MDKYEDMYRNRSVPTVDMDEADGEIHDGMR